MGNHVEQRIANQPNMWVRWTIANGIAVILSILAVLPLAVNLAYAHQPAWLRGTVGGAALGVMLGLVQWWLLRRPFALDRRWIGYSLISGTLGLAIGMQVAASMSVATVGEPISRSSATVLATGAALNAASSGLCFGLLLGLGQWLLLRRHVDGAIWWIVVNTIGWAAGLGLAALFATFGAGGWLLIAGLVNGVLTGWLVQQWRKATV